MCSLFDIKGIALAAFLLAPSIYFYRKLYKNYKHFKKELQLSECNHQRHNCVVMYSRKYVSGWPPETIRIEINNLDRMIEPYIYFVSTAKKSLSIAVMTMSFDLLVDAICEASRRGVEVRLIVNFQSVINMTKKYKKLFKAGVKTAFYISATGNLSNIMHYKYMLKDADCEGNGYICLGSMNYTAMTTLINNYEDVVFSSVPYIIEPFYHNFEESWNIILKDNEKEYNKSMIADHGFD